MKATDLWPVLRLVALIVHVPAAMAGLSIAVAAIAGDRAGVIGFTVTAAAALGLGQALCRLLPAGHHPTFRETMAGCAAGWLAAALIGSVPFLAVAHLTPADQAGAAGVFRDFWSALFESMAGITSTGLTMVERPSQLPACLQWWRSFSQWAGGAGMIILILAVVHPEHDLSKLFRAEGHERAFGESVMTMVRRTWWIYLGFSLVGVALLWGLGMTPWESLNHAMAAVSTGGFTITDDSLAGYGAGPRCGVMALCVLGAISFVWHEQLLRRNWAKCWHDAQARALVAMLGAGAVVLLLTRLIEGAGLDPAAAALHWVSALTTAGFAASDLGAWSGAAKMLLILAMVIGGCTGSTAGGIKLYRVAVLLREVAGFLVTIVFKPWLLVYRPAELADEIDKESAGRFAAAAIFVVLWFAVIFIAAFSVALAAGPGVALADVALDVASALSNTGLSTGVATAELAAGGKLVFILLMWMGRLEILPVLAFLGWLASARPDDGPAAGGS